jgi:hypothetical protein
MGELMCNLFNMVSAVEIRGAKSRELELLAAVGVTPFIAFYGKPPTRRFTFSLLMGWSAASFELPST